jgi:NACHT C-terminal Alpha/Beta 2
LVTNWKATPPSLVYTPLEATSERIGDDSLWPDRWIALVSSVPEVLREQLFAKLCDEDSERVDERGPRAVLAATGDSELIGRAFEALCKLRRERASEADGTGRKRYALATRLEDLIRATRPSVAVAGTLARLSATPGIVELEVVIELFGRANLDDPDLKGQLGTDVRQGLRRYLKDSLTLALAQDDFGGGLKAGVALALARVGEPSDMSDLERLIEADIARVRRGHAARLRHERSAMADGAAMRWSHWYVRSIALLDPQRAEDVLSELLAEIEYEDEVAKALVRMARIDTPGRRIGLGTPDYSVVWDVREGRQATGFEEGRRRRVATAIKELIAKMMKAGSQSPDPDSFNGRLKALAAAMSGVDSRESVNSVMEILALPGKWDGWTRVEAMEKLVLGGARVDARAALRVLDPTIEDSQSRSLHDEQARYLLRRCLSVLPFADPSSVGVGRIKEIVSTTRLAPYELREIVTALGQSRGDDALDLLLEVATTATTGFRSFATEWIDAMAALDTPDAKRGLLGFVDPDIGHRGVEQHLEHHHRERLAARIAHLAQQETAVRDRLTLLCSRQLPSAMRLMLAEVLALLGTQEAMIAGLDLIQDEAKPAVPHGLMRGIENVFLERRPYGSSEGFYSLKPRSGNDIRARLLTLILDDKSRSRSAWALLGQIESWRLEYGRPPSEPRHPALDSGKPWPPIELAAESEGPGVQEGS